MHDQQNADIGRHEVLFEMVRVGHMIFVWHGYSRAQGFIWHNKRRGVTANYTEVKWQARTWTASYCITVTYKHVAR